MADQPAADYIDPSPPPAVPPKKRRYGRALVGGFLVLWLVVALWNLFKPLPEGASVRGPVVETPLDQIEFLADVTGADPFGESTPRQQVFDAILRVVGGAREYLVLDFFLFNEQAGALSGTKQYRELSRELHDALLARKRAVPGLRVLVLADPINDVYGSLPSRQFADFAAAGIDVVRVDLDALRDSNPIYSALWRVGVKWWADGRGDAWLPNPFDSGPTEVTFGTWARLLNFKANHRKVIVGDDGAGGMTGVVTSANAHDASSRSSNVGLRVSGPALTALLDSELALARESGWKGGWPEVKPAAPAIANPAAAARVQVLTEGEIGAAILRELAGVRAGDSVDVAMFYLSDRDVVDALLAAAKRGVAVRVLLDPNKDAFGREKNGIPNRPVASELATASDGAIKVRWFRTHGEQFHTKLVAVRGPEEFWFTLGSANLTRRNLGDYNLEANLAVAVPPGADLATAIGTWFDALWTNRGPPPLEYTAELGAYADPAQSTYWRYRLMEATGLSTF